LSTVTVPTLSYNFLLSHAVVIHATGTISCVSLCSSRMRYICGLSWSYQIRHLHQSCADRRRRPLKAPDVRFLPVTDVTNINRHCLIDGNIKTFPSLPLLPMFSPMPNKMGLFRVAMILVGGLQGAIRFYLATLTSVATNFSHLVLLCIQGSPLQIVQETQHYPQQTNVFSVNVSSTYGITCRTTLCVLII